MVAKTEIISNNGTQLIIGSLSAVLTAIFILALLKRWLGQRQRRQSYDQVSDHLSSGLVSQKILVDSKDEDEDEAGASAVRRLRYSSTELFSIDDMDSDDDVIDMQSKNKTGYTVIQV